MVHLSHHHAYSGHHANQKWSTFPTTAVIPGNTSIWEGRVFAVIWTFFFFCFIKTIIQLFDRIKPKLKKLLKKIFCHKTSGFSVHVNAISDGVRWNLWERTHLMFIIPRRYYQSSCRILQYRKFQVVHIVISIYVNYKV